MKTRTTKELERRLEFVEYKYDELLKRYNGEFPKLRDNVDDFLRRNEDKTNKLYKRFKMLLDFLELEEVVFPFEVKIIRKNNQKK